MKKDELKSKLQDVFGMLKEIETRARKLKNQNLADIAASAHGRVKQLCDHPDTDLIADEDKPPEPEQMLDPNGQMPFDPNAGAHAAEPQVQPGPGTDAAQQQPQVQS